MSFKQPASIAAQLAAVRRRSALAPRRLATAIYRYLVTDDDGLITEATRRWMDKGYGGFRAAANENWEPI